jgi:uncharacterized protein YdhG (YjbR/CyaY superfamily)
MSLTHVPHSGSAIPELDDDLAGYETTKASLHFPVDAALPRELVEKLASVRMRHAVPG